ncbi:hypothetical protein DVA67_020140 [Solirubrobacter sp. CPCC 204708]|nr:hypothetical protein [Solirubrobacter deserti]
MRARGVAGAGTARSSAGRVVAAGATLAARGMSAGRVVDAAARPAASE